MNNGSGRPTAAVLQSRPDVRAIRDLVLTHGGEDIVVPNEWLEHTNSIWGAWMKPLLNQGRLMGPRVRVDPMEHNQCHKNSTRRFLNGEYKAFATGFALCKADNRWYLHSWGVENAEGNEIVIETIEEDFGKYFGAEYSGEEGRKSAEGLSLTVTSNLLPNG